ncbi:MAG: S46 family peptidase [Myxococcales bacterium]|nr:S46 family peptidase [Myxococcales bacterium]
MRGLFDAADPAALRASRDPLLVLANALVDAIERDEAEEESRRGRRMVLEPAYFELLRGVRPGPLYPDANGTLRFSVATVRGYRPRDGLEALPQTTLRGQLAKLTGAEPFTLPERVVAAAAGAAESYWADPGLADLVLCLLADGDTTGGNSGSAVVNGRGEVVGLNFDRVWENIAGDVAYSNERSRNVIVDVRYLLWLLDRVEDAGALLDELGVGDRRGEPRRPAKGQQRGDRSVAVHGDDDRGPRAATASTRTEPGRGRSPRSGRAGLGGRLCLRERAAPRPRPPPLGGSCPRPPSATLRTSAPGRSLRARARARARAPIAERGAPTHLHPHPSRARLTTRPTMRPVGRVRSDDAAAIARSCADVCASRRVDRAHAPARTGDEERGRTPRSPADRVLSPRLPGMVQSSLAWVVGRELT